MRALSFASLIVFAASGYTAYADEPSKGHGPPYYCPLFVLEYYPPDALYYCDAFSQCGTFTGADEWYGSMSPVPYVTCPDHCGHGTFKKKKRGQFPGLARKRQLAYMHEAIQKPTDQVPTTDIPVTLTGTVVNKKRNSHFLVFTLPNTTNRRYAKVIEFQFNRKIATGEKEVNDVTALLHWESRYVAFEVEVDPTSAGHENKDVFELTKSSSDYSYHGRIMINEASKERAPVLILLAH